jgi:hypothetical protein
MSDRRLLFLACRHHSLEIVSAAVFNKLFKSSGPQTALFSCFKEYWKLIDIAKYAAIDVSVPVKSELTNTDTAWLAEKKKGCHQFPSEAD